MAAITKLGVYAWPSPVATSQSVVNEIILVGDLCIERQVTRELEIETMLVAGNLAIDQLVLPEGDAAIERTMPSNAVITRVLPNNLETL